MNDTYRAAVERLAALREEEKMLNDYILLHRKAQKLLGIDSEHPADVEQAVAKSADRFDRPTPKGRITDNPKPAEVAKAAIALLKERGRPMTRRQLHAALLERGVVVRGTDPVKTLGTMLWRSDAFEQVEGEGYWPKDEEAIRAEQVDVFAALGLPPPERT